MSQSIFLLSGNHIWYLSSMLTFLIWDTFWKISLVKLFLEDRIIFHNFHKYFEKESHYNDCCRMYLFYFSFSFFHYILSFLGQIQFITLILINCCYIQIRICVCTYIFINSWYSLLSLHNVIYMCRFLGLIIWFHIIKSPWGRLFLWLSEFLSLL